MIKMLVSSFYNTLIDEEDAIPTSTMLELDRVKQNGTQFVVITNRLPEDVLYYNRDYPFIDYIISLNGSIIVDVEKEKTKYYSSFTKEEIKEIEDEYKSKEILYYTKDNVYNFCPQEAVYKIEIKGIKKTKESKFYQSIFQRNKISFLEISKNTAYDALMSLGKKEDEILGIMGNESELKITELLPRIYVVKNASKSLKEKTKNITKSNKQKGVETVLKNEIK